MTRSSNSRWARAFGLLFALLSGCDNRVEQLQIGALEVPMGQEVFLCRTFRIGSDTPFINRFEIATTPGLVDLTLYQSLDAVPDAAFICGGKLNQIWGRLISFSGTADLSLPGDSIMTPVRKGSLLAQVQFVSTPERPVVGQAQVDITLHYAGSATRKPSAGAVVSSDPTLIVPPGDSTAVHDCLFSAPARIYALAARIDSHVQEITVNRISADGSTGPLVYSGKPGDAPLLKLTPDKLIVTSGSQQDAQDGLRATCRYHNDTSEPLKAGPRVQTDAQCNLVVYYYLTADLTVTPFTCSGEAVPW